MSIQNTPTQIINNALNEEQRLGAYISLKGFVGYKACKLAGFIVAERHKKETAEQTSIDRFNEEIGDAADAEGAEAISNAAGMSPKQKLIDDLQEMVGYFHYLNFECVELLPLSAQRDNNTKVRGVSLTEGQLRESFKSTIEFLGEGSRISETYEEYVKASASAEEEFLLTEPEWLLGQEESENLWAAHPDEILSVLLDCGEGEVEFEELSKRAQIGIYENLLNKLPKLFANQLKRSRFVAGTPMEKSRTLAALKGLILVGMRKDIAEELNDPRYIGLEDFMYNFQPIREGVAASPRLIRRKAEPATVAVMPEFDDSVESI